MLKFIGIFLAWLYLPPRLTVLACICFAYGTIIIVYKLNLLWAFIPLGLAIYFVFSQYKKLACICACALGLSLANTAYRELIISESDISKLCQIKKSKIAFIASLIETKISEDGQIKSIIVEAKELLFPIRKKISGKTLVSIKNMDFQKGNSFIITGYIYRPKESKFPWQFNYQDYLYKQNIFCQVEATRISTQTDGDTSYLFDDLRNQIISMHIKTLGQREGEFLAALVIGNKTVKLPSDMIEKFQNLGLSHILAASGFNLSIVTGVIWYIGRFFIHSPVVVSFISLFSLLIFDGLAGNSSSILRASIMCSFVLVSKACFRNIYSPAALALALFINVLLEPLAIADIGFQLSYAATAGIIMLANKLKSLLKSFMHNILAETMSVILSAQLFTLPIQLYYFWNVSFYFLLANILISFIIPSITILAFISSAFACINLLFPAELIDKVAHYPIVALLYCVDCLSSFTTSATFGPPFIFCSIFYYFILAVIFIGLQQQKHLWVLIVLFILGLSSLFLRLPLPELTIYCRKKLVICFDRNKALFYQGDVKDKNAIRFLGYFGVPITKPVSSIYKTEIINQSTFRILNTNNKKFFVFYGPPWRLKKPKDESIKVY